MKTNKVFFVDILFIEYECHVLQYESGKKYLFNGMKGLPIRQVTILSPTYIFSILHGNLINKNRKTLFSSDYLKIK